MRKLIEKVITGTETYTVIEETDEFGMVWTETKTEQHAVPWVAPLSSEEIDKDINYNASVLVRAYNGETIKYLRHYHEYFEETKFNRTNTAIQQAHADAIYRALLSFDD